MARSARPGHARTQPRSRPAQTRLAALAVVLVTAALTTVTAVTIDEVRAGENADGGSYLASDSGSAVDADRGANQHATRGGQGARGAANPMRLGSDQPITGAGGVPVSVRIDTDVRDVLTDAPTVKDLLIELDIILDEGTALSHDLDAVVVPDLHLVVARIETRTVTEETSVPFETVEVEDPALAAGVRHIETAGREGIDLATFHVRYADDVEVLRTVVVRTARSVPRDEVVRVGTGASAANPGGPAATQAPEQVPARSPEPTQAPTEEAAGAASSDAAPDDSVAGGGSTSGSDVDGEEGASGTEQEPTSSADSDPEPTPTPEKPEAGGGEPPSNAEPVIGAGKGQGTTPGTAKALAKTKAAARGWGAKENSCLVKLWNRESNWNFKAKNPSSTARGIPQAIMSVHFGAGWRTSETARAYLETPSIQIDWGLNYIGYRYATPCAALDHSNAKGWY